MEMTVTGVNKAFLKFERNWSRFGGVAVSVWQIWGTESDRNGKKWK